MKFPQRLCFVFCTGSCAEGVRFSASRKIPIYLKILESPRVHKGRQSSFNPVGFPEGAACSAELLLEPFSSAAASCACEQCCCVTHMQLPEMLCNGRRQEGEPSSSESGRGPSVLLQSREGVGSARSSHGDWRRAAGSEPATPRPLPPTAMQSENPGPAPEASRRPPSEGASEREAFNRSASGPAFDLASVHTLPLRVTYCYRRRSLSLTAHKILSPLSGQSTEVRPLCLRQT